MPDPTDIAERTHRTKLTRWVRIVITILMIAVAIALSIWAYRFYEYSPWTRDGRVRRVCG